MIVTPIIPAPNVTDFLAMIRNEAGIVAQVLPDNSPVIGMVLTLSLEYVYKEIACVSWPYYVRAVYLFALDRLINFASDPVECGSDGFFTKLRSALGVNSASAGLIQSSSDNGTSQSYMIPDSLKNMSLADLQLMKTPYGREYLGITQMFSPVWGLS